MPPRTKKVKKRGDKEFRAELMERLAAASDPNNCVGTICTEAQFHNNYDHCVQVRVDMSYRTGQIKAVLISFYNGRGNSVGLLIAKTDAVPETVFLKTLGKAITFVLNGNAMAIPADELSLQSLSLSEMEDDIEWLHEPEVRNFSGKASMKWVSCKIGSASKTVLQRLGLANPPVLLIPNSAITNDSWAVCPELECLVHIPLNDEYRLGEAVLQRAILALSRDEAKLHPDSKYHGEKRKWADI